MTLRAHTLGCGHAQVSVPQRTIIAFSARRSEFDRSIRRDSSLAENAGRSRKKASHEIPGEKATRPAESAREIMTITGRR
jgi:hypothetical protein